MSGVQPIFLVLTALGTLLLGGAAIWSVWAGKDWRANAALTLAACCFGGLLAMTLDT